MVMINPAVDYQYFLPGLQLPSLPESMTTLRPVSNYTALLQRNMGVNYFPK